jgi:RNA polymerase sigma-70 factor (ECF subfamily)
MSIVEKSNLAALARNAASGDPRALASLLDELAPVVVRTARLIVGPGSAAAEDAAQEALADLARAITTLREPEAVVAWAARIAARRALRMARWERLRRRREVGLGEMAASHEPSGERIRALSVAFDRLPPRQRAIAVLRLYLGLSEVATASALEISTGAVKSQLHEARRKLADSRREAGFAPTARAPAPAKGRS